MSFRRGLVSQGEVIHALILRETRTRFGNNRLGYFWAVAEPGFMIFTFWLVFSVAGRPPPFGMDLFSFITTGIVPYMLFASCTGRVSESINANKAMLFYPHVMPLDLVIARCILETMTYVVVFFILVGLRALYFQELEIHDPLLVVIGFSLAALLGTTLGLIFCALGTFSAVAERILGPFMRPFFWFSGLFFAANELPQDARDAVLWNPVLHSVEYTRGGWFESYNAIHADAMYPLAWILGMALVGLSLERVARRRIELT